MLRDYDRRIALVTACQTAGIGVILAALVAAAYADLEVYLITQLIGLGVFLLGVIAGAVASGRWDRALQRQVAQRSPALAVAGSTPVPARVVRSRRAARQPGFVAGTPGPVTPAGVVVMLVALADDGARLALALMPPPPAGPLRKGTRLAVVLEPDTDVAVLVPGLPGHPGDPRWQGELPGAGYAGAAWGALSGVLGGFVAATVLVLLLG